MTPENWPKPTKLFFNWDDFAWQSYMGAICTPDSYEYKDIEVYTATQVREIVRMEVEAIADLIAKTAATHHTTPWGDGYNQAALDIESGIRATLKENKDAD